MTPFLLYLIKSGILLSLLWLLYRSILGSQKNFHMNRIILLASSITAIFWPLLPVQPSADSGVWQAVNLPVFTVGNTPSPAGSWEQGLNFLWVIYLIGSIVYMGHFLFRLATLLNVIRRGTRTSGMHPNIIDHKGIRGAFTFFGKIIWNEDSIRPEDRQAVLRHEMVHIRQKHSIDLVLMELICALHWFNPFAYLLKKEVLAVHEFLADEGSVNTQSRPGEYLEAIYAFAVNSKGSPYLFNSFGKVSLKRRLIMMNKRNQKSLWTRYLLAVPLMLIFVLASSGINAGQIIKHEGGGYTITDPYSVFEPQEQAFKVVKDMPKFPGGQDALVQFLAKNINYPEKARKAGTEGTVYVTFIVDKDGSIADATILRGIGGGCDEEALRVVKMMPKWSPGKDEGGKAVKVQMNLPVKFKLSGGKKEKNDED